MYELDVTFRLVKQPNVKMEDLVHIFEKCYIRITQKGIALSPAVTAFKFFDSPGRDLRDRQIVHTGVDNS